MKVFYLGLLIVMALTLCKPLVAATLSGEKLESKKEGWYATGLPLVNYSTDDGTGYGGRAYVFFNGSREDPYFENTAYFMQFLAQYYATTYGRQFHKMSLDMPYIFGSEFRVKTEAGYEYNLNENYFGVGRDATHNSVTDNMGIEYNNISDLEEAIEDSPHAKWNKYRLKRQNYSLNLFRDVGETFKIITGFEIKNIDVESWSGRSFDGNYQVETMFDRDYEKLKELAGGRLEGVISMFRVGLAYDSRDLEQNPGSGSYIDYCFEISDNAFGSDFNYKKNNFQVMQFVPLFDSLVFAARLGYTTTTGDIPFYEESFFGFAGGRKKGLGGGDSMLGYTKNRFVSKTMTLANAELRWQFARALLKKQYLGFQLICFADAGNCYENFDEPFNDPGWGYYKISYGGGLALVWNLATVIHFKYGMSDEDSGISIDFDHKF